MTVVCDRVTESDGHDGVTTRCICIRSRDAAAFGKKAVGERTHMQAVSIVTSIRKRRQLKTDGFTQCCFIVCVYALGARWSTVRYQW